MTPLAGFFIALLAGLLVRPPRLAMAAATPPWLAVLAVQTWHIGSGQSVSPDSAIRNPGYPLVQIFIFAASLGIAAGVSAWRSRHLSARLRRSMSTVRIAALSALATLAATPTALLIFRFFDTPSITQQGNGEPPLPGVIGMIALVLALAVLAVVEARARRTPDAERRARTAPGDAS